MSDLLNSKFNYNHLSVKDLLEARDIFHVHLINKKNVIATAIGRYRVRKHEPWPNQKGYAESLKSKPNKPARTLENSEVRDYSWPCIMVFVSKWEEQKALIKSEQDDIVPRSIYMPDGRIVPICVVEAPRSIVSDDAVNTTNLIFPANFIGGGFPVIVESQGRQRIASIGCIVTDGNKYYAITNKHVTGDKGTPIYTLMKGKKTRIGVSSGVCLGKEAFEEIYDGWSGKRIVLNYDAGLIEIDNINMWKTDVIGTGTIGELANLNTNNITLSLISSLKPGLEKTYPRLKAFGAVSGKVEGEICGLFYRYKSTGGVEYVCDFLIGGADGKPLNVHHGDSGTLWLLPSGDEDLPIAIQWGQHNFIDDTGKSSYPMALASSLTNICVHLDVDIVRGWNIDNNYTWGKTGHFKVAARACELVTGTKLKKLMMANQVNIGYTDTDLLDENVVSGAYSASKNKFVPLADVADIIWRSTRKLDSSNHFADIDEKHPDVFGNKTLLSLCMADDKNIDIDFWIEYFEKFDLESPMLDKKGKLEPRNGALPFRVWQMYLAMIKAVEDKNLAEFICSGGTMAHYVGDACQPLHISHLHHGRNESEADVHSVYETDMIDRKMKELFDGVNAIDAKVKSTQLIGKTGKSAAKRIIKLMDSITLRLTPEKICDSYSDNKGTKGYLDRMWNELGKKTIQNISEGCHVLAILWQSAWKHGGGNDKFTSNQMKAIEQSELRKLYNNKEFVPSYRLKDPKFKALLED